MEQSQAVWEAKDAGTTNADDVRELLNYRDAFLLVSEYLSSGLPITETLIRSIHQKLVEGVRGEKGKPGAYRLVQNDVVSGKTGKPVLLLDRRGSHLFTSKVSPVVARMR